MSHSILHSIQFGLHDASAPPTPWTWHGLLAPAWNGA
jgi:hypothetical protein